MFDPGTFNLTYVWAYEVRPGKIRIWLRPHQGVQKPSKIVAASNDEDTEHEVRTEASLDGHVICLDRGEVFRKGFN